MPLETADSVADAILLSIWIDADSCPKGLRRVLLCAAGRLNKGSVKVPFHFVAASSQPIRSEPAVYFHQLEPGPDACDRFIEQRCRSGDIVITRDIVFAERLCLSPNGGHCHGSGEPGALRILNDRGIEYTRDNVRARRLWRDRALELRNAGLLPVGAKGSYGARQLRDFAACFDHCLSQQLRRLGRETQVAEES